MIIAVVVIAVVGFICFKAFGLTKSNTRKRSDSKAPMSMHKKAIIRAAVCVVAGLIILLINPFEDMVYYIAVIAIMLVIMWSILDIVKMHNRLTMRKPFQLESRGGDEE